MNNNKNVLDTDMDAETKQLLADNDRIVGTISGSELSPEEREAKVNKMVARIAEIASMKPETSPEATEALEVTGTADTEVQAAPEAAKAPKKAKTVAAKTDEKALCLKNFRQGQGWNQQQAAKELQVTQGLISQVESGRVPMSKKLRAKVEAVLAAAK